jgi:pescadillo
MGTRRVEGKKKIKSIKSKVTSRSSSKKKVSRMGKKVKKGEMGKSTDFITRSAVLRKLQITLKDFRRLCILKGVYPRVPDKAPNKGADKVYYDIKDIAYLNNEPLLHKFREFKSFMKKVRKEAGRYQFGEARRKHGYKPIMRLDHLVKERYPRFIDALRDLDDALCMLHLFASLPSVGRVTADKTKVSSELVKHWQYYVARTRCLSKVFVSVKGTYFQAEILGEKITWITPHPFTQIVPREVDMRVMLTFLEFYEVYLKFVLFKLYNMQGLKYPPVEDHKLHTAGCFLLSVVAQPLEITNSSSITSASSTVATDAKKSEIKHSSEKLKSLAAKMDSIASRQGGDDSDDNDDDSDDDNEKPIDSALNEVFDQLYSSHEDGMDEGDKQTFGDSVGDETPKIFSKLKFFINREVPLPWMQLCIISQGGQIGWDNSSSPFGISDPGITHHVIDRPLTGAVNSTREYVQPQWVFDSINAQVTLPTSKYRPGTILPPHLSPFVDDDKEGYVPKYREELRKLKSAVEVNSSAAGGGSEVMKSAGKKEELSDGEEEEENYQEAVRKEKKGGSAAIKNSSNDMEDEESDDDDDDDDDDSEDGSDEESEEESGNDNKNFATQKGSKGVVLKPKAVKQSEVYLY